MGVNPGPVNPYQQIAIAAAQRYGIDPNIFMRQIGAESNWDPNAKSSAGAQGIAQFMPATAKGMGVNPYDPRSALYGAAKMDSGNLKKYGSYQSMLSAYNSGNPNAWKDPNFAKGETANYVKKIMSGENPYVASSGGVGPVPAGSDNMRINLLTYLMKSNQANANHEQSPSVLPYILAEVNNKDHSTFQPSGAPGQYKAGDVIINKGANRPGMNLQPGIMSFAEQVAGVYGQPLRIGTGTNHHQYSRPGVVSDHWNGNAVDIPANGKTLIRMGQSALIAAGADPAWAYKQKGGLYNIGGHQVIFNTDLGVNGGQHFDHLHISGK